MFIPDYAFMVSNALKEAFFSGWETEEDVYGKKAMAG